MKLPSEAVERYTKVDPHEVKQNQIIYGDFNDVDPFQQSPLHVHFASPAPFLKTDLLKRTLQLSHWGVLQVEEHYDIRHVGATLKGVFSRLDFQRFNSPSAVPSVTAVLPSEATDIYFRDAIGNISSSAIRAGGAVEAGKIEVEFTQRFPLFGGWKTSFYFGYNFPLSKVLNREGGQYKFSFPLASPMRNMHVAQLETILILPEGVSDVDVRVNGKQTAVDRSLTKTNLDTSGRPTFTLVRSNSVSSDDSATLEVSYSFSPVKLLHEPFLLTMGFATLFVATMIFVRIF